MACAVEGGSACDSTNESLTLARFFIVVRCEFWLRVSSMFHDGLVDAKEADLDTCFGDEGRSVGGVREVKKSLCQSSGSRHSTSKRKSNRSPSMSRSHRFGTRVTLPQLIRVVDTTQQTHAI